MDLERRGETLIRTFSLPNWEWFTTLDKDPSERPEKLKQWNDTGQPLPPEALFELLFGGRCGQGIPHPARRLRDPPRRCPAEPDGSSIADTPADRRSDLVVVIFEVVSSQQSAIIRY